MQAGVHACTFASMSTCMCACKCVHFVLLKYLTFVEILLLLHLMYCVANVSYLIYPCSSYFSLLFCIVKRIEPRVVYSIIALYYYIVLIGAFILIFSKSTQSAARLKASHPAANRRCLMYNHYLSQI